jgi:hypothetical protein
VAPHHDPSAAAERRLLPFASGEARL